MSPYDRKLTVGGDFTSAGNKVSSYLASWTKRCCIDRVGDADGIGGDEPTIGDVMVMIDAKYNSGTCVGVIACLSEADVDQSGGSDPTCDDITLVDISYLIDYLFITGPSLGLPNCL